MKIGQDFTKFQKRNVARKKRLVKLVEKKVYTPFPPAQQPRRLIYKLKVVNIS